MVAVVVAATAVVDASAGQQTEAPIFTVEGASAAVAVAVAIGARVYRRRLQFSNDFARRSSRVPWKLGQNERQQAGRHRRARARAIDETMRAAIAAERKRARARG